MDIYLHKIITHFKSLVLVICGFLFLLK